MRIRDYLLILSLVLTDHVVTVAQDGHADFPWSPEPTLVNWDSASGDKTYGPQYGLEASGLAFDENGDLYMLCENRKALLRFPATNGQVQVGVNPLLIDLDIPENVDLEAIAIFDKSIYVCDEVLVKIFVFSLPAGDAQRVTLTRQRTITIKSDINNNATSKIDRARRSIEGMVVLPDLLHGTAPDGVEGPWFYLLDEHDKEANGYISKVYIGREVPAGQLTIDEANVVSFPLGNDPARRLTELTYQKGNDGRVSLFAIHSTFDRNAKQNNNYRLVRLDLNNPWTDSAPRGFEFPAAYRETGKDNFSPSYEGAAISPITGALFVATDNQESSGNSTEHKPVRDRTLLFRYSPATDAAELYARRMTDPEFQRWGNSPVFLVNVKLLGPAAGHQSVSLNINGQIRDTRHPVPVLLEYQPAICRLKANGQSRRFIPEPHRVYTWYIPPAQLTPLEK